jgi:hypothetical protein
MAGQQLVDIPKVLTVEYYPEHKAVVAHWHSFTRGNVVEGIEQGAKAAGKLGVKSWVIDLTEAPGVPTQVDQSWLANNGHSLLISQGIVAIINIVGDSAMAKMGAHRWSETADKMGIHIFNTISLAEGLLLADKVSQGAI